MGFCFRGKLPVRGPIEIFFKDKWDLYVHEEEAWTSYKLKDDEDEESQGEVMNHAMTEDRERARVESANVGTGHKINVLEFNKDYNTVNMPWGLALDKDEKVLWGPVLFEMELLRSCLRGRVNFRRPSALVVITSRRLAVVRFRNNFNCLGCFGVCNKAVVESLACVPLKMVLGFAISEKFQLSKAIMARCINKLCCLPNTSSDLEIKIMTNAGFGKTYLGSLTIPQKLLPRASETKCYFEEQKVLELRRWLGNLALFYYDDVETLALDLWKCRDGRGWWPAA